MTSAFAHLIALRTLVSEGFDLILEDNVRAPVESCAERLWGSIKASEEWTKQGNGDCHIRFFGWLGSIPNLKWILQTHAKKKCFTRTTDPSNQQGNNPTQAISIFTFPLAEDLEADWEEIQGDFEDVDNGEKDSVQQAGGTENAETEADNYYANEKRVHTKPGGNFVWGAYAYWMTREAYETIIQTLRNDVGALLWKGKRARYYSVKPIDKILPRQVISSFGANSVHLSTHPAFFRAPMLTSKIHTQWDPEFCKSSEFQMQQSGLDWSDLWLSYTEMEIVKHRRSSGEWLTIAKFKMLGQKEREEQNKFL